MDLGARPVRVFFDVTIPVIAPALVSGWLLAFTLSLDDLVVASFVTGPGRLDAADGDLLQGPARGQPRGQRARHHHHRLRGVRRRDRRPGRCGGARAVTDRAGDGAFRAAGAREHWVEMTYGGALSFLRRRYTPRARRGRRGGDGGALRRRRHLPPRLPARAARDPRRLGAARRAQGVPVRLRPLRGARRRRLRRLHARPPPPRDASRPPSRPRRRRSSPAGAKLLALGGDHFIAWPLLKAHAARHGALALIQVDAHGDLWPDDPGRIDHGTMMGRAIREGLVDPARSTQLGIRTFHDTTEGLEVLTAPWLHRHGIPAALEVVRARAGDAPVYLSFDIDALDPAFAPGTGTPVPGGLATWQALELVRGLGAAAARRHGHRRGLAALRPRRDHRAGRRDDRPRLALRAGRAGRRGDEPGRAAVIPHPADPDGGFTRAVYAFPSPITSRRRCPTLLALRAGAPGDRIARRATGALLLRSVGETAAGLVRGDHPGIA